MKYTYTETPGDLPNIDEWIAQKLKEIAKTKYGLDITVEVISKIEVKRESS